ASAADVSINRRPPGSTPFPYTTLFRSKGACEESDESRRQEGREVDRSSQQGCREEGTGQNSRQEGSYEIDNHEDSSQGRDEQVRSEEHTSELQSRENLVCRLLLEKKKR